MDSDRVKWALASAEEYGIDVAHGTLADVVFRCDAAGLVRLGDILIESIERGVDTPVVEVDTEAHIHLWVRVSDIGDGEVVCSTCGEPDVRAVPDGHWNRTLHDWMAGKDVSSD